MGPLQSLRERGGGDGAPGSKAGRPRALRVRPPGRAGTWASPPLSRPRSASLSLPQLAGSLPLPTRGQPGTSLFLDRSLALRVPVPLQIHDALSSPFAARSVPDSAPGIGDLRGRRSPQLGHRGPLCAHPRAPRSPTRPSDRTQPCGLPGLVPPSPQLQSARRSPALPRSLPLGPGSDTTDSRRRRGLNAGPSPGGSISIFRPRVPGSRASVPRPPAPPGPARLPF